MDFLILFVGCALVVISLITLSNVVLFPRLRKRAQYIAPLQSPFVSVMIPARNEAGVIGQMVENLLAQDYPNFEILVLDDHSTDDTAAIVKQVAETDHYKNVPQVMVIEGKPLPPRWMGKNWACHQMAQIAKGEILVFTDADVQWSPEGLSALITQMQHTQADLYSVWPTQRTVSWAERLCVPLMAVVILGYLPVVGTHYVPLSSFGAANGQCMAWRRSAYEKIGGHAVVKENILEDVTLARMVKGAGLRLRMADGNQLVSCRMYIDWMSVRNGYAKNILAGYGGAIPLILAGVFHWLIFLFPWALLVWGDYPITYPILLITLGLTVRALTAAFTHQRVLDALLMPVSVVLMTRIALQALWWHFHGGPQWKGRTVPQGKAAHGR